MPSILIIDDEREITNVLSTYFERAGHEVMTAASGSDGVMLIQRARPDLVLLDLKLPDMTGFEVLERTRDVHPVVIMITGHGDVALAVQAMQSGAESFLT